MRFRMSDKPFSFRKGDTIWTYDHWFIYMINENEENVLDREKLVAVFIGGDRFGETPKDLAPLLAGDYCEFLNSKYIDKNFNEEWGKVDVEARIKYHEEQIKILKSGEYYWNENGDGVEQC
jgi:hypothetical protein